MSEDALETCPETGQKVKRVITGGQKPQIKGWSPDKEAKKEDWIKKNPGGTTLPEYKKKIDENTEKARKQKAKAGLKI